MKYRNIATINIQALKSIKNKVGSAMSKAVDDKLAESVKLGIVKRTQLGNGVDEESKNTTRLKPLKSKPYKKLRKKSRRLSSKTTPSKSNLTATGQLLNSITYVKLKIQGTRSYLFTIGDRRGRGLDNRPSTIGNKLLTKYLKDGGRHFFDITKSQRNAIARRIKKRLLIFLKNKV